MYSKTVHSLGISVRNDLYNEKIHHLLGAATTRFGDESELFIEILRELPEIDICALTSFSSDRVITLRRRRGKPRSFIYFAPETTKL